MEITLPLPQVFFESGRVMERCGFSVGVGVRLWILLAVASKQALCFVRAFSSLWDAFMFICEKPMFFRIRVDAMKIACLFS